MKMIEWSLLAPGIAGIAIGIGVLIFVRVRLNGRRRVAPGQDRHGG
jgi:preprotein translocase subunit SecD